MPKIIGLHRSASLMKNTDNKSYPQIKTLRYNCCRAEQHISLSERSRDWANNILIKNALCSARRRKLLIIYLPNLYQLTENICEEQLLFCEHERKRAQRYVATAKISRQRYFHFCLEFDSRERKSRITRDVCLLFCCNA